MLWVSSLVFLLCNRSLESAQVFAQLWHTLSSSSNQFCILLEVILHRYPCNMAVNPLISVGIASAVFAITMLLTMVFTILCLVAFWPGMESSREDAHVSVEKSGSLLFTFHGAAAAFLVLGAIYVSSSSNAMSSQSTSSIPTTPEDFKSSTFNKINGMPTALRRSGSRNQLAGSNFPRCWSESPTAHLILEKYFLYCCTKVVLLLL